MADAERTPEMIGRRFKRRRRRRLRDEARMAAQGQGITPQIEEELLLAARQAWMQLLRKRPVEDPQNTDSRTPSVAPIEELPESHFLRRSPKRAMG
jgi:hypothetical protein